ncbi:MAG: dipeptide epimerase [Planctomycetaceae bacterium]|jgi:L-Ala-D/L-Glu epimerase|nr:dipeptide epimerase [Planctomycetaceae bacterium]MBT6153608.1 dipeptide epimerase [Planctomycetaceae bacterium]MBT6483197.1 dipeptide epimerase [Planctomycetaceae bacterium]MBT6494771.1 dipeptide epimerase [Planctomycetaceae bacterium]
MHIVEITAYHVRIPLKKPIRHASHTRRHNDTLVVRCRLDDGTEGWGEGPPREYVTGETIDSTFAQLAATNLRSQLDGEIGDLAAAIVLCDSWNLAVIDPAARDCFGNVVRCAIEISILDAVTRHDGVPLSAVTNKVPETLAIRQQSQQVQYSAAVTAMTPFRERVHAWKLRLYGFHQCKVKVGMDGADDAASLARIRRILGESVDLRIDANEAWNCDNLEQKLQPLLPFGISSCEQPVPHGEVDGLAALRGQIGVPIMLDESLCSMGDARRAIERGTCDLFNVRLSKCGGFLNSLRLAAVAHQAGLGYQLGCMVGETGILSAAGRHFAASIGGIRYLEGSYDRHLVRERLTVEDLTFGRRGIAAALTGPGLGVEIDRNAVSRTTIREARWTIR